jgi:signal transduction histidine kinase
MAAVNKDPEIILVTQSDHHGVLITIRDNGPGISNEDMKKIFDPLFTTKPGKTGLGLTICREILDELGGSITVESFYDRGASFTVELPLFFRPYPDKKSNI